MEGENGSGLLDPNAGEAHLGLAMADAVPDLGNLPRVVGLGGSAGSIPALRTFFEALPPDSGMAFVVVLHLAPEHESSLSEVLQPSTSMRVRQAQDGERIEPNCVYVIPPGKQLTLADARILVTELPKEAGRRFTIDVFFRSLAEARGPQAVGIVLSGADGDGAVGIKRIKERGGLTIAQNPEEAPHPSMPNTAIATKMVDWVLDTGSMPGRLLNYQAREGRLELPEVAPTSPAVIQQLSTSDADALLREVLSFLRTRTGRDFSYYKPATIVRRVARRMQVNELDDLAGYLSFLREQPGEAGALLNDLLISVTSYFRDRDAFKALEARIPDLFKDKGPDDTIRVWVPACATGEEAYSIGMLLSEHAGTLEAPPALQIFASDLDEEVLSEARAGVYLPSIASDVSSDRLQRYFVKQPKGYRVRSELREIVLFALHDVLKDSPFSRLDLLSCRNLLIYLNRDAQARAFAIFHFALKPSGLLFLGTSESLAEGSQLFQPLDKPNRLYFASPAGRSQLPVPSGRSTLARSLATQATDRHDKTTPNAPLANLPIIPGHAPASDRATWAELHLRLIERMGPPSLVVDADHNIVHLSEGATRFLQFVAGEPSTNLLRAVQPMLRTELHAALCRTRQTGEATTVLGVPLELTGETSQVDITVSMATERNDGLMLVQLKTQFGAESARPRVHDEPLVPQLERELEQTKQVLQTVVEQHEASTEEQKASNEELEAINEELRSATEELETGREELQSINEELTTLNQELKSKVDEVGRTNSDLQNLMGATAIPTVFLDRELRIMRFTPSAVELFSFISADIGRPLADLQHRLVYPELLADAARVLQSLVPIEREVGESGGRYFLVRLLPYRTVDERIAGVVLAFVDVTERQLAKKAMDQLHHELEVRVRDRTSELDTANLELRGQMQLQLVAERFRQDLQHRLLNAQEDERRRISRELHDEVGQQLSALMLSLLALEAAVPGSDTAVKLRELRNTAEQVGQEIHQLAAELRPVALDELGLWRALTGYLEAWQARTGIQVDLFAADIEEVRLPAAIEIILYRVVQESTNNIYKHASAKTVSVSVQRAGDQVLGIIEDDGAGFDLGELEGPMALTRLGIFGMRERCAMVGGELTLDSRRGRGTTVRVLLPLSEVRPAASAEPT